MTKSRSLLLAFSCLSTMWLGASLTEAQSSCASRTLAQDLDAGLPGPRLWTPDGPPQIGRPFGLQVIDGPPGAFGLLALGAAELPVFLPQFGVTVFPSSTLILEAFALDGTGTSARLFSAPILDPGLCAVSRTAQAGVFDPTAMGGVRFTNGLRLQGGVRTGPLFPSPRTVVTGTPTALARGDLDGDARPDLVVGARFAISVLHNPGDGRLELTQEFALPSFVGDVALADLDGDSNLDLVAIGQSLFVYPGNGDGSFSPASAQSLPDFQVGVAIGDVDRDGDLDVLTAGAGLFSVFLGRGDGTLQGPVLYSVGQSITAIEVVDLNLDGRLDVLVSDVILNSVLASLGNGDGTFGPPIATAGHRLAVALAVGDLDGDGIPDVATGASFRDEVNLGRGRGDGSFAFLPAKNIVGKDPRSIALEDVDEDGALDLIATVSGGAEIALALGGGDGTFGQTALFGTGKTPIAVSVADMDGDGSKDVVVANSQDADVGLLLGHGDGSFGERVAVVQADRATGILLADFDGDGRLDLAGGGDKFPAGIDIHLGQGDGVFTPHFSASFGSSASFRTMAAAFVDGDASLDLIALTAAPSSRLVVLLGQGDGTFAPAILTPLNAKAFSVGDMDGDGIADLVAAERGAPSDFVTVRKGLGQGSFVPFATRSIPNADEVELGDLDGDGDLDVVVVDGLNSGVAVFWNSGDGSIPSSTFFPMASRTRALALADVDADGVLDLVAGGGNGPSSPQELAVRLGTGDGSFGPLLLEEVGYSARTILAADLDRDGSLDLVGLGDFFAVHRGRGDGTFEPQVRITAPSPQNTFTSSCDLGDVDRDGSPDVMVGYGGLLSGAYSVHLNALGD